MWTLAIALVALLHAAYLVFQMLGALLILRHPAFLWAHLPAVGWGVLIVVTQGSCPVTRLEKTLITRSGGEPYPESYLDHYVFGAVLPEGSQAAVYGAHLLIIVATYVYVLRWRHPVAPVPAPHPDDALEVPPGHVRPVGPT